MTVTAAERAYLLDAYHHFFAPPLSDGDVLGTFAGLRPLIRSRPSDPSSRSREYRLLASPNGLLSVAGGKYTTYRHMAEEITDTVAGRLRRHAACRTHEYLLDGSPREPWPRFAHRESERLAKQFGLTGPAAWHLVSRYGRRAEDVARCLRVDPQLARPLVPDEPDLYLELRYQREYEMALLPADYLLRRMRIGMYRPELLQSLALPGTR